MIKARMMKQEAEVERARKQAEVQAKSGAEANASLRHFQPRLSNRLKRVLS